MLDTRPLERLVTEAIPWATLRRHVDEGRLAAVAVAATEISSGRTVVWIDDPDGVPDGWANDPFVVARPTRLTPDHALASAALPLLFPVRRVDGAWYCDGGLRLNTPLAPALRLGVDRLLVIGLSPVLREQTPAPSVEEIAASMGSMPYLSGKVLNALMLDRVDYDVDRLALMNGILEAGVREYGPSFLPRINETIRAIRGAPYRVVPHLYLRPSRDVGLIAKECLARQGRPTGWQAWLRDTVVHGAIHGVAAQADLLSYLFFDRAFAAELIELGRADAAAEEAALVALLA
jgi:NTE family protein